GGSDAEPGRDRRTVTPMHVVGVPAEILGRKLPVARRDPFVGRDDLDAALAAVDKRVDIPGHLAEVLAQRRRLGIDGRKIQALVTLPLCAPRQAPALAV